MSEDTFQDARILIVDDEPANVRLLERLLAREGYTNLESITDPRRVVPECIANLPWLVLLDLHMPYLDGIAVLSRLRARLPAGTFLPVLVLTADITPEAKQRALASGANDFLTKPFDPIEVVLRTRNLLETRYLHQQLQQQNERLEEKVRERTRELEEARGQVLELYRALAERNEQLQTLVVQLLEERGQEAGQVRNGNGTSRQEAVGVERLTRREHEVLQLVAAGHTNREIADALVLSVSTVKIHVEHIIAKLGVADRTQAAVRAVELGLLHSRSR